VGLLSHTHTWVDVLGYVAATFTLALSELVQVARLRFQSLPGVIHE